MGWCYRINPHEVNCHQTNSHDQICYQIKSNFLGKKSIISTYDNILDLLFMSQLVENQHTLNLNCCHSSQEWHIVTD